MRARTEENLSAATTVLGLSMSRDASKGTARSTTLCMKILPSALMRNGSALDVVHLSRNVTPIQRRRDKSNSPKNKQQGNVRPSKKRSTRKGKRNLREGEKKKERKRKLKKLSKSSRRKPN